MTDAERITLLFGPYRAPALRRGDRATCLYRDCDVVVTSWSDGPISWPRCRPVGQARGGSGLLVDEELARAVRHESSAAIQHWWRVSKKVVWRWRRAFAVGRADPEGSRRLIRAAAEEGGAVIHERGLTPEEVERRRRTAVEMGLGENLVAGWHGPPWTPDELALLGAHPDEAVAAQVGRSADAVGQKRRKLGVTRPRPPRKRPWTPGEDDLVRTLPPAEVVARTGRSFDAIYQRRAFLGVPAPRPGPAPWAPEEVALLGALTDGEAAARTGRSILAVRMKRRDLGRPNPASPAGAAAGPPWTPEEDDLVRRAAPREAAMRTGRTIGAVYSRRSLLGLPDARGAKGGAESDSPSTQSG